MAQEAFCSEAPSASVCSAWHASNGGRIAGGFLLARQKWRLGMPIDMAFGGSGQPASGKSERLESGGAFAKRPYLEWKNLNRQEGIA
jgi:hypothetical protein